MAGLGEAIAALRATSQGLGLQPGQVGAAGRLIEVPSFGPNPGALRMRVYVPEGLSSLSPLVVVLHGCTQTAEAYAAGAGWLSLADRFGFAVLCPEQTRANNPNLCFNWFEPHDIARGGGEAASIHAMVVHALRSHDLDPARVFVTGLSAGGAMANVMLATYPETFAAGALVSGLPYGAASNVQEAMAAMRGAQSHSPRVLGDLVRAASESSGPWPRIAIWQGEDDTTVRPAVADELVRQWSNVHGLDPSGGEARPSSAQRRDVYWRKPSGEIGVELHRIVGMGHGAPLGCNLEDGCGTPGAYLLEVGVSSSLEIARSWGLATSARSAATPTVAKVEPGSAPRTYVTPSAHAPDIGAMISDALRVAGLLR